MQEIESFENVKKITDNILASAEARTKEIMAESEKETEKIIGKAEERAREIEEDILKVGERKAEQEKKRIIADGVIRARKLKLGAREEVISGAFKRAEDILSKIHEDKDYPEILENLIKESSISIGGGDLEIVLRKDDTKLVRGKLNKISREIEKTIKNKVKLDISKENIKSLGVIVRTKDGKIEVNNTLEKRLDRMRRSLRSEIAKILF